ncbi:MAG: hypothetical protein ACYTBP_05835 [Planctomycetota bacterium]|jgi:hypothetical protein
MRMVNNNKSAVLLSAVMIIVICSVNVLALPPDPENAALLYYQAFLLQQKFDETKINLIRPLARGEIDPNEKIAEYIEKSRYLMNLVETAADLEQCDWGVKYSDGFEVLIPHLSQTRIIGFLLLAEARILAEKDDYESAIDRCLTAYKMGIHISQGHTMISCLVGYSIHRIANGCIRDILSSMEVDLETLQWLKGELDAFENRLIPIKVSVEFEHEIIAGYMNTERIHELLPMLEDCINDKLAIKAAYESIPAADEQFCMRNKEYLDRHFEEVLAALDLPYKEASERLEELSEQPKEDYDKNNPDALLTCVLAPSIKKAHHYQVQRNTFYNGVRAAVEIYMIKVKTGKLPDLLPAGLPIDEFSGNDFGYRKTTDGFVLVTKGREIRNGKMLEEPLEYQFKVAK